MTLIAAWKENSIPILIGDLLTSRALEQERKKKHYKLPTREDLEFLIPPDFYFHIVNSIQKTYKISSNFAIAWCGTASAAKNVIKELKLEFSNKETNIENIKNFFTNLSLMHTEDYQCTIIGWILHDGGPVGFKWESYRPKDFLTGDQYIEGSGKNTFSDILIPHYSYGSSDGLKTTLNKITKLIGNEVLHGNNLLEGFGGGYQVIYQNQLKLDMLENITFLFLELREDKNNLMFKQIEKILKINYNNDIVETLALVPKMKKNQKILFNRELDFNSISISSKEMFYTFPIYAEPKTKYLVNSNLSLSSQYYCIYFFLKLDNGYNADLTFVISDAKKEPYISLVKDSNNLEVIALSNKFFEIICSQINELKKKVCSQVN